ILGFSKKEINEKIEEIIDFAEIREFIDMPVQNYSSGMKVRLGFAVAAQMQPDVLIIDEVLAVGDLGFVLKCFKTIDTILPKTAIVFVSHSTPMVSRICTQIILMEKGEAIFQGKVVGKTIDFYYMRFADNESNIIFSDGSMALEDIQILNAPAILEGMPLLNWGDEFKVKLLFKLYREMNMPQLIINIFDKEQRPVALFESNEILEHSKKINNKLEIVLSHQNLQLSKGIYS